LSEPPPPPPADVIDAGEPMEEIPPEVPFTPVVDDPAPPPPTVIV
jgi:hypothetical protein